MLRGRAPLARPLAQRTAPRRGIAGRATAEVRSRSITSEMRCALFLTVVLVAARARPRAVSTGVLTHSGDSRLPRVACQAPLHECGSSLASPLALPSRSHRRSTTSASSLTARHVPCRIRQLSRRVGEDAAQACPVRDSIGARSPHTSRTQALTSGVNVIDTSTNYTDGLSEELIGETLEELIEEKEIAREVRIDAWGCLAHV